ncbi:MAG: trigger factor [Candidatus Omnitrophica bacterium]|nr:trigger factor [Candidatus Omnitrophota bacterium]
MSEQSTYKVSVKDGKACEKILNIQVSPEAVQKEYESFFRSVAPKAKIPGFRPGKAPQKVVAMHFKSEAREEVMKTLISDSYHWAIEEKTLKPLLSPQIDEVQFDEATLSYRASVEVRPKIKLSRVEGLSAKKAKVEVKPAEIEEQLKKIQTAHAQFKVVEDRAAIVGDFLIADYTCTVDGKQVEQRSDDWLEIREEEYLKGFSKQLVGVKPGESREVRVKFPEKAGRAELMGKEGVFTVQVKEIKKKELPELNDDLAREAGEFKTLQELKDNIQKELQASKDAEAEAAFEKELLGELLKHNKVELPKRLVERRLQYLLEQAEKSMHQHEGGEAEFTKKREELTKELTPEAARQVHLAFLLNEISEENKFTVTDEDLKKKYAQVAARFRRPTEEVETYYSGNDEALDNLKEQIHSEKAVEFIKQHAKQK